MGKNLVEKILAQHLISGNLVPGEEIGIRIDQTLTQDATGTMAYLQFEAMNVPKVKTELSVSYIDHNTIQIGFENADDHRYLQSVAQKYGIVFSRAGNGICHQVHLERFGKPAKTLIGSDSHTPTCGALSMIAIGAGGLDVALAMAGKPFYLICPQVIKINLTGNSNHGFPPKISFSRCWKFLPPKETSIRYLSTAVKVSPLSPFPNAPRLPIWARNAA